MSRASRLPESCATAEATRLIGNIAMPSQRRAIVSSHWPNESLPRNEDRFFRASPILLLHKNGFLPTPGGRVLQQRNACVCGITRLLRSIPGLDSTHQVLCITNSTFHAFSTDC